MTHSMTGFAGAIGAVEGWQWAWELRSVNGRNLDLRLRLPDWITGLDPAVRAALKGRVARGSVTLSLRVSRNDVGDGHRLSPEGLARALDHIDAVEAAALQRGLTLTPASAADVLTLRGVIEAEAAEADQGPLLAALTQALPELIDAFNASRAAEGASLAGILAGQLGQTEALVAQAGNAAAARSDGAAKRLRDAVARVLDSADGVDEARLAQELALLAVKADVTEEIDRLSAHVGAARALLATDGPVGRKLDFLMQEFNREANTLCSKAQSSDLTAIGLDLKTVIDQMREQVQNLE